MFLVAGVAVAAAVAGMMVFGGNEPDNPGSAAGRTSALKPLALGDEPLWTAERLAGRTVIASPTITVRDDVALVRGYDKFSLLNMATGQVRWSVDPAPDAVWADLPGVAGAAWFQVLDGPLLRSHDGEPVLLTDYWYPYGTDGSKGVALLSAETGDLLWRKDIPDLAGLTADDQTALIATTTTGIGLEVHDPVDLKTLALDLGTGETLWEQPGIWPDAMSGDVALGHRSPKRRPEPEDDTELVAFDRETGAQKWDLSERFARSELFQAAGDVALVNGSPSKDPEAGVGYVVATDSGKPLHTITGDSCDTDGSTLVTCSTPAAKRGDLNTFDIPKHTMTESQAQFVDVTAVAHNRVFLEDFTGRGYSVDRTGTTVDKKLPGLVIAISDRYVMLDVPDKDRTETYQLTA